MCADIWQAERIGKNGGLEVRTVFRSRRMRLIPFYARVNESETWKKNKMGQKKRGEREKKRLLVQIETVVCVSPGCRTEISGFLSLLLKDPLSSGQYGS